jgi:DNA-directed RNA polymerase specialized sigma24 family protein
MDKRDLTPLVMNPQARRARSSADGAVGTQMVACCLDGVRRLSPNRYDVDVVSEFEERFIEEIADRLSISRGAARIRLRRARNRPAAELRRRCFCYDNKRGELMGTPK